MEKQILKEELSKTLGDINKSELENLLNNVVKGLTKTIVKAYDNKK